MKIIGFIFLLLILKPILALMILLATGGGVIGIAIVAGVVFLTAKAVMANRVARRII